MKAALYARVSTTDKGQDVQLQLVELRRFAEARGWSFLEFVDEGISGIKSSRPALDELIKAVKRRKVDAVVVWKLDRLGRSLSHLLHLLNDFQSLGISFVSLRESIDMSTPTGKLMAHLLGAFAEFERALIQERVKAGIENARRKGKKIGRAATSDDYKQMVIGVISENPCLSVRKVAAIVNLPSATVHRIIKEHRKE